MIAGSSSTYAEGSYELTMSVDRQEFTGWWTKIEDTDESLQYLWTGYRAPPVSWTGIWDEPNGSGNMILVPYIPGNT